MKYKIKFEIEVPNDVPYSDVVEWVEFELGESGSLSGNNAMGHFDLQAIPCSVDIN